MKTTIRRGREAESLWFLDPVHTIHTATFDGEAFLVTDDVLELRDGDDVVRLVRGEVAFRPCADGDEARIVPLAPLDACGAGASPLGPRRMAV
jgi:hypothetical protein